MGGEREEEREGEGEVEVEVRRGVEWGGAGRDGVVVVEGGGKGGGLGSGSGFCVCVCGEWVGVGVGEEVLVFRGTGNRWQPKTIPKTARETWPRASRLHHLSPGRDQAFDSKRGASVQLLPTKCWSRIARHAVVVTARISFCA